MIAGPAAGADDEAPLGIGQTLRPFGEPEGELARRLVVARHAHAHTRAFEIALAPLGARELLLRLGERQGAGRAHEHDGVVDVVMIETGLGLHVLGEYAQRPCLPAVQELLVVIGLDRIAASFAHRVSLVNRTCC